MTWELTKGEKQRKKVHCPFCDKADISVNYSPPIKQEKIVRGSSKNKRKTVYKDEKYNVHQKCPNCGASAKKIEKALNSGKDYKSPDREKVIERMKKAGLPTRI